MSDVPEKKVKAGSAGYQLDRIQKALWPRGEDDSENSDFLALPVRVRDDLLDKFPSEKQGDVKYPWPHRLDTESLVELVSRIGFHFGDPVEDFSDGVSRGTVMMTMIELAVYHTPSEGLMRRHSDGETNFYNSGKQTITTDGWRVIADAVSTLEPGDEEMIADQPAIMRSKGWEVIEVSLTDLIREDGTCIIDGKIWRLDIPPWQRPGGAWKQKKAKDELIDTIRRRLPLPPIFGWRQPNGEIAVVDGQQRIEVLRDRIHDWADYGDYEIAVMLLDEDMEFEDLRALYHRLNQSGRRLTSTELTLLTYHRTPLAEALIEASRKITDSCRTGEEEDWMSHLVENVIFRGSSIDLRRSILQTSNSERAQPITRHELAIYRILMRVCAYSMKNDANNLPLGYGKSTIKAANLAFEKYVGEETNDEAVKFVDKVLEAMMHTHNIFGSKAFTLNGKHHEFALTVQVSGIMEGGTLLSEEAAEETNEKWDGFSGRFDDLRQNSKTIWAMHDKWGETVGLILDPLRLSRQVIWEQDIAQRLVGLPDEDVEMMRSNFLSGRN